MRAPKKQGRSTGDKAAGTQLLFKHNPRLALRIRDESTMRPSILYFGKKDQDNYLTEKINGVFPRAAGYDWRNESSNPAGFYETISIAQRADAAFKYTQDMWNSGADRSVTENMKNVMQHSKSLTAKNGNLAGGKWINQYIRDDLY